jgi:hypothetical protein
MEADKIVNSTQCSWNLRLNFKTVFRPNQKDAKTTFKDSEYTLDYISCLSVSKIEEFFFICRTNNRLTFND